MGIGAIIVSLTFTSTYQIITAQGSFQLILESSNFGRISLSKHKYCEW